MSNSTIHTVPRDRRRIDGVLLDLDGTLVASNDLHARAWVDALERGGVARPFSQVRPLIGMGGTKLVETLVGVRADDPRSKELRDAHDRIFLERYLGEVRPQPGARDLVEHLRDHGIGTVVATASASVIADPLIEAAGVGDLIDARTTSDDADHAKPAPDVVVAAMREVGCNPGHCILIGDTPYDVQAGRGAGVEVIAVRCGGWDEEGLRGALEVYDSPADIVRYWMQTPFRRSLADLDLPL